MSNMQEIASSWSVCRDREGLAKSCFGLRFARETSVYVGSAAKISLNFPTSGSRNGPNPDQHDLIYPYVMRFADRADNVRRYMFTVPRTSAGIYLLHNNQSFTDIL